MKKLNGEKTITKKVTRRIVVALAATMFSLSLVGCGSSGTTTTAAPQTTEAAADSKKDVDPLSFVKSGEIYFDNQLGSKVTISVDGQKVEGNTTAFKKGMSYTVEGLDPEGSTSFVIVSINKGEGVSISDRTSVVFSSGLDNSRFSESLTKALNIDMEKVCVCLFKPGETWNKKLSEEMNTRIQQYVPAGMLEK